MKKFITVYGMTCENCRRTIINGLLEFDGVSEVSITLSNRLVEITFDEKKVTLSELKKSIHKLGYDAM